MAADDVVVTISAPAAPSITPGSDTMVVTVGPVDTTLPPASSGASGFYQNLGDGRGYIPLDLYIGTVASTATVPGAPTLTATGA